MQKFCPVAVFHFCFTIGYLMIQGEKPLTRHREGGTSLAGVGATKMEL